MTRPSLGPVFANEWLTTSRRWQTYAARSLFVAALLLGLASVWAAGVAYRNVATPHEMAEIGRAFYAAIVFTQLTLALLVAPAATAGVICQDKVRGNLAQLLVTDLTDSEIVLGKLAARLVPVIGLVSCSLPVLAIGTLLGGIDPLALTGVFAVTLSLAILSCTIAFAFSVWGTKPYEVLLATFAVLTIWLLAFPVWEHFIWLRGLAPLPRWAIVAHPYFLAFAPYARLDDASLLDFAAFAGVTLVLSAGLAVLSIARLRAVTVAQADRPDCLRSRRSILARLGIGGPPSLERNPPLWYEWHRKRPSRWIGALIGLYNLLALVFTALAIDDNLRPMTPVRGWFPAYVNAFMVIAALPLLLVIATTALVEERARGSLDVLLTTPLSSRSIVLAKWWNVFREVPRVLVLPTLISATLAWTAGRWSLVPLIVAFILTAAAAWTSIGLAISTWVPRIGRAISLAAGVFALVGLGWPILADTLLHRTGIGPALGMISPFYGLFDLTHGIVTPHYVEGVEYWGAAWTLVQAVIAGVFLAATLATFDRTLGRIPERATTQRRSAPRAARRRAPRRDRSATHSRQPSPDGTPANEVQVS